RTKVTESTSSCCGGQKAQQQKYIDPVCGMSVTDLSKPHTEYSGQTYYFCCQGCLNKFQANPEQYLEKNKSKTSGCGCASKSKVEEKNSCCGGAEQTTKDVLTVTDLVCGMQVKTDSKFHRQYEEQDYYFCSESCLNKFNQQPEQYLQSNQKTTCCCGSQAKEAEKEKKSICCVGAHPSSLGSEIEPVCGKSEDTSTDLKTDYQGETYFYCNPSCLVKFKADPQFYLLPTH